MVNKTKVSAKEAQALECLGRKLNTIALDPDPDTDIKLSKEFNCVNCDTYGLCAFISHKLMEF